MQQFDICLIRRGAKKRKREYAAVLQHRLLNDLETYVVAPLLPAPQLPAVRRLRPAVTMGDEQFVLAIDRLAAVDRRSLGTVVGSLELRRDEIAAAIDLVFFGI